jgi:hypothetical protein
MPACAEPAGAAELAVLADGEVAPADVVAEGVADVAPPLEPFSHPASPSPVIRTSPAIVPLRM